MPTASNDVEVKFQSAVALVRSLPQKGPFQPSYGEASKVYGYYKQAQLGPCKQARPSFWDVLGRAKWDAWSTLGEMPKPQAMENYVNEIKKLFERLTKLDEFAETQKQFAHAIIPFCEINNIELPDQIAEYEKIEKKKKERKKVDAANQLNGSANGQRLNFDVRSRDMLVKIDGDDIELLQTNVIADSAVIDQSKSNGSLDGNETPTDRSSVARSRNGSSVAEAENGPLASQAIRMQTSSYENAESSDDDIYCDSYNPDEKESQWSSGPRADSESFRSGAGCRVANMVSPLSTMSTEIERTVGSQFDIDLTNVTQDSSLLKEDSQLIQGDTGLEMKNIHSTPAVKMKPFNNHDISDGGRNQNGDHSTDTSTLSSLSAPENGTHENRTHENGTHTEDTLKPRAVVGELELELKEEFEARWPRPARKGRSSRHRHRGSSKDGTRHHQNGIGKQDLVLSARGGNSQTDLASNDRDGKEKGQRAGNQQSQAQASRPERTGSSRRPQRTQRDSSSDPNDSSESSEVSGETIGEQIVKALGRLEQDMRLVLLRLDSIEDRIRTVSDAVHNRPWWAVYIPSRRMLFFLLWPVFINIIIYVWKRRRRKR